MMSRTGYVRFVLTSALLAVCAIVSLAGNASGQMLSRRASRWAAVSAGGAVPSAIRYQDHSLYAFVRDQQDRFVRTSFNEQDCFTWDDLTFLREQIAAAEIAQLIQTDENFDRACDDLKQLSLGEREGILRAAAGICRPTWAQLGRIDPAGQTDAGQRGDILVGQLVVGLVRQQVNQSVQQESPDGAQLEIGKVFHAVSNRTPVQVDTVVVATIDAGQEVTVIAVNGPWAGVSVTLDGRQNRGWIQSHYLAAGYSTIAK